MTAADAELAKMIETRYLELGSSKNHFAILGVTPVASQEAVKQAYHALAKTFHPDRLPRVLAHLSEQTTAVFEKITEAYDVLSDDVKRAMFESALARTQPMATVQNPKERALELMKRGEVLLKKREFSAAEQLFIEAHQMSGSAVSMAARAWCIYMDPQRKAEVNTAKKLMSQALSLDSNCDRASYQLGVIARVEGNNDMAERFFRSAISANPRHLEANQELRLIEMRRKKEKKGFFG
jgi:curved DNA-binding protein CbpA